MSNFIPNITLLTGNVRKKQALENTFDRLGLKAILFCKNLWLPEIQAIDTVDVARFAAKYGADLLKKPVIKMDSGFFIEEFNGFPGVLVNSVDKNIGAERFFVLLEKIKNKKARIKNSLAYCEPGKEPIVFSSSCEGVVAENLTDADGSFIDKLFIPVHRKNKKMITLSKLRKENPEVVAEIWGDAEEQFGKWFLENF